MKNTIFRLFAHLLVFVMVITSLNVTPLKVAAQEETPFASEAISVIANGIRVNFPDQAPLSVNGRTLVPVRGVFEVLGFVVEWDSGTQQVTLTRSEDTILITLGSDTFTTNGERHALDVPAQIIGGRTMLPIRAVMESVGYNLEWDENTRTVRVGIAVEQSALCGEGCLLPFNIRRAETAVDLPTTLDFPLVITSSEELEASPWWQWQYWYKERFFSQNYLIIVSYDVSGSVDSMVVESVRCDGMICINRIFRSEPWTHLQPPPDSTRWDFMIEVPKEFMPLKFTIFTKGIERVEWEARMPHIFHVPPPPPIPCY
ncbi:MAG: copper amine oxidase N-terminal domain-containing protein [Defluviitaleaceae bacterium]|nr:copper amine oxidase N-terminal domain-containing protein [Defluviitaleaceae bacterium]